MNFDSVLIVTYGRSGSTLLQGVLNKHEQVLVRGENHNLCFGLFQSYQSMKLTELRRNRTGPTSPFYGQIYLDEEYYLTSLSKMVKNLLLGDQIGNEKIVCYGFKEIRYEMETDSLKEYLDFLKMILPNSAFIFNTRNRNDVLYSREKVNWKGKISMESLEKVELAFQSFEQSNQKNSFSITYEDVIGKSQRLIQLHSFLGLPYDSNAMNEVLAIKHSIQTAQSRVSKLRVSSQEQNVGIKNFKIIPPETRYIKSLEDAISKIESKEERNSINYFSRIKSAVSELLMSIFHINKN